VKKGIESFTAKNRKKPEATGYNDITLNDKSKSFVENNEKMFDVFETSDEDEDDEDNELVRKNKNEK